jgi:predicted CopG family antitoxin
MLHTITISESVFALLDQEAKRNQVSPSDLAERMLAKRLSADKRVSSLAELYAEDADEDQTLAEAGVADYAAILADEHGQT